MYFKLFTGKETVKYAVFAAIIAGILWGLEVLISWLLS
jgi:hypothetical protein